MIKKYFIKEGYNPNPPEIVREINMNFWGDREVTGFRIYRQYYVYETIRKLIKKYKLQSVLDIGCGTGIKLVKLIYPVCYDIYGVDCPEIVDINRKNYGPLFFFSDDIENPKFPLNKKFDLIIAADVIEHLVDPGNLLSYIKGYSHKSTYIVISTPERDLLRGKENIRPINKSHVREWNRKEFYLYLKSSGFTVLYHGMTIGLKIFPSIKFRLKNFLGDYIKLIRQSIMFKGVQKINHQQLVICSLNKSKIPKLVKLKIDFLFSFIVIKVNLIMSGLYKTIKRFMNNLLCLFKDSKLKKIDRKVPGFLLYSQGLCLYELTKELPKESVVVEIGSFLGRSTCFIAEAIKDKHIKFFTIDTFQNQGMSDKINDVYLKFLHNVKPYKDLMIIKKGFSHDVVKNFKHTIDMMFIDGDHRYPGVRQDINDWIPLVKKDGIIAFHDYCASEHKKEGVKKAVDEELNKRTLRKVKCVGHLIITKKM